ncbi:hypothetical protein TURU_029740 [Turdus rufiventris]|nr:hypothetical protein TURU_029740 [Turdus rufiventris]
METYKVDMILNHPTVDTRGNSQMSEVKLVRKKAGLAEQESSLGNKVKREGVCPVEARNGILQISGPTKTMLPLAPFPSPSPALCLEKRIGGTRGKGHTDDWDFFLLSCEESWLQNTLLAINIASWLCAKAFNKESHSKHRQIDT